MNDKRQEAIEIVKIMAPQLNLVPIPRNTGIDTDGFRRQVLTNYRTIKGAIQVVEQALSAAEMRAQNHPTPQDRNQ